MAVYKCKMCGGTLEIGAQSVATCEYCGTQQTLPKLSDERRIALYERAGHFLRNNEFDKATGIYEQILNEDQTDAEAYWSLVLCRFGIEYVEDPATRRRIPTVNRAQFTSVFDDDNYRSALQHADSAQRQLYEAEAKTINDIQRGILSISQREEPFDVFICYKETDKNGRRTPDSVLANELYHQLTQEGFKVFFSRITLEDKLGVAYEPYIFAALNSSKVMVVLGTRAEYFQAVWVKNEWSRYLTLIKNGAKKILIPAYRDMDPYDLPEEFSHLQAQDMSRLGFMQDLIRGIKKITYVDEQKPQIVKETVVATPGTNTSPLLRRVALFLEDGEWERADDFCEQILNMEPECAEGYLGKLMVQLHVHTKEDLKNCAEPFDNSNHYRKIIRFADDNLREELTGYIDFINTRNENARLEKLYQQAVVQLENANSEDTFKAVSKLFAAISGYKDASSLEKQCLAQAENSRLDVLYTASKKLMTGDEISAYQKAIAQFEALGDWRDSSAQIEACHRKIREIKAENERQRLEKLYREASNALERANNEAACKAASQLFATLGDYKDSAAMVAKCHEKAEAIRKDALYDAAKKLMTGNEPDNYRKAIRQFEELGSWRDSEKQILACVQKIEEIEARAEKQRLEKIRQEQQRLEKLYQDARRTLEKANSAERFKAASGMFAAISGYKDSADLSQQCLEKAEEAEKNARYTSAKKLMSGKNPNYEEAILRFEELDGWRDSNEQIELCLQRFAAQEEGKTQRAESASGKRKRGLIMAAAVCVAVALAVVLTTVVIPNSNYKKAVALMDEGHYKEALAAFEAMNGYKDSAAKLAECKLPAAEVGDYVVFGTYEQDNDLTNRAEEIEWLVLDKQDDKLLVISKFGLDCQLYNSAYNLATWQTCTLRNWLNDDFLSSAFSAEEQVAILAVNVEAHENPDSSADPGNATQDKVFLLSTVEADNYFSSGSARQCEPTAYAVARGAHINSSGNGWWWLRSPGQNRSYAAGVSSNGNIGRSGNEVFNYKEATVRPALWITLSNPAALEDAYIEAVRLMDEGSYDEAITAFEALGGYKDSSYLLAVMLMDKGSYEEAIATFELLDNYQDSADRILECRYQMADAIAKDGSLLAAVEIYNALGIYKDSVDKATECTRKYYDAELENLTGRSEITKAAIFYYKIGQREKSLEIWDTVATRCTLDTGNFHTVALKNNGTVVVAGGSYGEYDKYIPHDVAGWKNIIAIAAGDSHTVGLTSDHTVVATGWNGSGQCDVSEWTDIVAIAAGRNYTLGLKADGTVVGTEKFVAYWTDIMTIADGIALKTDGSVMTEQGSWGTVSSNKDAVAVARHNDWNRTHRVVLCEDGTVYKDGLKSRTGIASIHVGSHAFVAIARSGDVYLDGGLMSNSPVLSQWDALRRKDVVSFSSNSRHAVVLLADGTVRSYGDAGWSRLNVGGWSDIKMPQY